MNNPVFFRACVPTVEKIPSLDSQRDSHATSQTAIYANITQTGCIRVYCSWFWVVLAGFVGGFGSFWVVLAGSVF